MPHKMKRRHYAEMFGPTTGDRVRLGDTSLVLEVERDHAVYGDECKFGGGKAIREGMGQAAGVSETGRPGLRHHQCAGRGLHGHLQGGHRNQGRPDRGHRQSGQPGHDGGRHRRNDRRRDHRSHRRRGAYPHGGRHRHAHSFHLSAAGARSHRRRSHHDGRRRHRPGHRAPAPPPARPAPFTCE